MLRCESPESVDAGPRGRSFQLAGRLDSRERHDESASGECSAAGRSELVFLSPHSGHPKTGSGDWSMLRAGYRSPRLGRSGAVCRMGRAHRPAPLRNRGGRTPLYVPCHAWWHEIMMATAERGRGAVAFLNWCGCRNRRALGDAVSPPGPLRRGALGSYGCRRGAEWLAGKRSIHDEPALRWHGGRQAGHTLDDYAAVRTSRRRWRAQSRGGPRRARLTADDLAGESHGNGGRCPEMLPPIVGGSRSRVSTEWVVIGTVSPRVSN